jgi:hypothetical protein
MRSREFKNDSADDVVTSGFSALDDFHFGSANQGEISEKSLFNGTDTGNERRIVEVPNRFITLRAGDELRDNEHYYEESMIRLTSPWFKSPDEAREAVVRSAKEADANILIEAKMTKKTFNEGNYQYSKHRFTARAGVYFKFGKNGSTDESSLSRKSLLTRIETTASDLGYQEQTLVRLGKRSTMNLNPLYLIILAILLFGFVFGAIRH